MKKVYRSFEEMMAVIRGKVTEVTPKEYQEPEKKPKKKAEKKEGE